MFMSCTNYNKTAVDIWIYNLHTVIWMYTTVHKCSVLTSSTIVIGDKVSTELIITCLSKVTHYTVGVLFDLF